MTGWIEENNDPLISLLRADHTCTQGHSEVDRLIKLTPLDTDVEMPLSRHTAMIRPIRTQIVLTDLKTQPGTGSQLDQIDESRLGFLAGFATRFVLRTEQTPIELGKPAMISRVEHRPAYPQLRHHTGKLRRPRPDDPARFTFARNSHQYSLSTEATQTPLREL